MIVYIIKFSACLAIFIAFYKIFLEKENMHQFKRFYLIGAILLAIGIPFITFTQYVEPLIIENTIQSVQPVISQNADILETSATNFLPIFLLSLYGLGVFLFGIKFLTNLSKLILKIKRNPKYKSRRFVNVLLQDLVTPHTFFSYIFLNKHKYETQQIPEEVLLHEETHARQKHSIDILIIEALQVIFWFNPLIYLTKNSIKLNHEFLADKAVLQKGIQPTNYQQILLAFSTNQKETQLANAINYSSIKKRITVMKTHTSKQKMWLRSLVLLPLLALTLYSFSSTKHVEKEIFSESTDSHRIARSIDIKVFDNGTYEVDGITATKKSFVSVINQLHQDITPEIRNQIINIHVNNGKAVSDEEVWFIYNSVLEYGFHRIVAYNQEIIRAKGNKPFAITSTDTQKRTKVISKNKNQDGASREQMKEYNRLAKQYNSKDEKARIIKLKDYKRLKYLYDLMSAKQKKSAEPFPNFPPPPAPPVPGVKSPNQPQDSNWLLINSKGQMLYNDDLATLKSLESKMKSLSKKSAVAKMVSIKLDNEAPIEMAKKVLELMKKHGIKVILNEIEEVLPPPPIPENATPAEKARMKKITEAYAKKHPESVTKAKLSSGEVVQVVEIPMDNTGTTNINGHKFKYVTKDGETTYYDASGKAFSEIEFKKLISAWEKDEMEQIKIKKQLYRQLKEKTKDQKEYTLEEIQKLAHQENLAYKEARAAKLKTEKGELAQVRELQSKERVLELKEEKLAYKEARKAELSTKKRLARIKEIQTPKPPKSPLDHVIDMAKNNALFYLEGKEISSDKAIDALKKNKSLNIQTIGSSSKQPKVYITKKPVVIDN